MGQLKLTVSRNEAIKHSMSSSVLLLESNGACVLQKGQVVESYSYKERDCFYSDFSAAIKAISAQREMALITIFANNLFLSYFYPIYKRVELVKHVVRSRQVCQVEVIDKVIDSKYFPLTGAEGDNTYHISWDSRCVLKYVIDALREVGVQASYKAGVSIKGFARTYSVFFLKCFVVIFEILLAKLLSKKISVIPGAAYVVRDDRTISELNVPPSSAIIFNPSFRCFRSPAQLFRYYRRSISLPPRLVSKKSFFNEFNVGGACFHIPGLGDVELRLLASSIYHEHFEKICYYRGAKALPGRVAKVITPEFIGPIAFLESLAWHEELVLESVQTFALDRSRISNLPCVHKRVYSSDFDRKSFLDIESAAFVEVKKVEFNLCSISRSLAHIGVLTQPNFNVETGLGMVLNELLAYGEEKGIRVSVRVHPRDCSDYSEYQQIIDSTHSANEYVKGCDLIVVKTTSLIDTALRYGVPFVSFAGDEANRISYMKFSKARVSKISELLELCSSYPEFLINYRGFQMEYFGNANDDA